MLRRSTRALGSPKKQDGKSTFRGHISWDYRNRLLSSRPWSFILTVVSILAGSILALKLAGNLHPFLVLLTMAGTISAHAATNLLNDYFDTLYGVDRPGAPTTLYRPHPILGGILPMRKVLTAAAVLYTIAAFIGLYLTFLRGWPIIALAIAGGIISITYTAGPIHLKYRGFGEIFVFLVWGPLLTLGAYFVQTGHWTGWQTVLWASAPLGIWVALVLLANNLTDLKFDEKSDIYTVAVRLGRKKGLLLFGLLMLSAYLLTLTGIMLGYFSFWILLVFLTVPPAARLFFTFSKIRELPADADPQTAHISAVFGALLIFSFILEHSL